MTTTPGTAVNARANLLDQHVRKMRDSEYASDWREAGCPPPDSRWWQDAHRLRWGGRV